MSLHDSVCEAQHQQNNRWLYHTAMLQRFTVFLTTSFVLSVCQYMTSRCVKIEISGTEQECKELVSNATLQTVF